MYAILSVFPDKIAGFLYEYHDTSYTSLHLRPIPLDRSGISFHRILQHRVPDIYLNMHNTHMFVEHVNYVDYYHVSYFAHFACYAYLILICILEQKSHSVSSLARVQQQRGSYCSLLQ